MNKTAWREGKYKSGRANVWTKNLTKKQKVKEYLPIFFSALLRIHASMLQAELQISNRTNSGYSLIKKPRHSTDYHTARNTSLFYNSGFRRPFDLKMNWSYRKCKLKHLISNLLSSTNVPYAVLFWWAQKTSGFPCSYQITYTVLFCMSAK